MTLPPRARLIRERAEYLLQIETIGSEGKYWQTIKRMLFPHLIDKPYRRRRGRQ